MYLNSINLTIPILFYKKFRQHSEKPWQMFKSKLYNIFTNILIVHICR